MKVDLLPLGQSGYRMAFPGATVYIDPYLSSSVEAAEGVAMRRLFRAPFRPADVAHADWVLVTHIHMDHCDLETLLPLAKRLPSCKFVAPSECLRVLASHGIESGRLIPAPMQWIELGPEVRVLAVPAAHPTIERDAHGNLRFVGYVLEYEGRRFYHAGDTSLHEELLERLRSLTPIEVAFVPVNERNFYKESKGIIGNMTLREAFGLMAEIDAKVMVPTHWDMFAPNSVHREEIELLYRLARPSFSLRFYPDAL